MSNLAVRTFAALIVGALCSVSLSRSEEKKLDAPPSMEELKSELAKLREIFASVDRLPAKDARWVEVREGTADDATWHAGWLLRESDSQISVLTQEGHAETFEKKGAVLRAADFAGFCRDWLAPKKQKVRDDPREPGVYRFYREKGEAEAAVLDAARLACWASAVGNDDLARQLLTRAVEKRREVASRFTGYTFEATVHQFVARRTEPRSQETVAALFGDKKPSPRDERLQSLERDRALAKVPYRPDHDTILGRIRQLESLTAEDRAWKEPTKEDLDRMNVNQKAAYWLHHLRDLNVVQSMSPGMCRVVSDSRWSGFESQQLNKDAPNPAVELKKLGYDALPQVIAHLDDDRPTRCVGFWRNYAPDSYYNLTYGDCCQQIFEAIALQSIYERKSTSGYPVRDGQGEQCKERAEKWWREFQAKGEKQVLVEATRQGNRDSYENAERLVKQYPEVAFEPLRDGIRSAEEGWIRSNMLNYMRKLHDERVVGFLREEAKGPDLYPRVNAMEGLLERGHDEAVGLLVADWMKLDFEKTDPFRSDGPERLLAALIRCGSEKAIAALAARWKTTPLDWRHHCLEGLRDAKSDFARKPFAPAANKAVEDLLVSCLADREESDRRRRTCDLAANALAVRWGDPRLFDLSAPLSVRNRRIVEVENVWRKKQGMDALPVPEPRRIPPVADAAVAPHLRAIVETSSLDAQRDASVAIERLGLGALPQLSKALASLPKDDPARERLSKLAGRLACIVSEIRFSEDSVAKPAAMLKATDSLKNRPLTPKALVELFVAVHRLVPAESGGMVIALDRDGDNTGVQLEIRVLPRRDPADGGVVHLRRTEEVVVDGQELLSSMAATVGLDQPTRSEWESAEWKGLVSALGKALEASPEKPFQVRVGVTRGR
jgi:hypothetical protein